MNTGDSIIRKSVAGDIFAFGRLCLVVKADCMLYLVDVAQNDSTDMHEGTAIPKPQ
jgi:hypothetical protein